MTTKERQKKRRHKYGHSLRYYNSESNKKKVTALRAEGLTYAEIAEKTSLSLAYVGKICKNLLQSQTK